MRPRVLVLMTTYNGAAFVAEQLDSVLAQKDVNIEVRIADDCSMDDTREILQRYASEHTNITLEFNETNKGCVHNFMDLIYSCDAQAYDYYAISDQDDIWLPEKLSAAVKKLQAYPSNIPALYYAGVENVDVEGESLGNEYLPYQVCADNYASLLLVQNWCLGCTSLMNGALIARLQERHTYDFGRMYDAWFHAVALYTGGNVVCDLKNSYIKRRITGQNTVGIMNEKRSVSFIAKKALKWAKEGDPVTSQKHTKMAQELLKCYASYLDVDTKQLVEDVAKRQEDSRARKRLLERDDIVMPTPEKTKWLRAMIKMNKF